MKPEQITKFNRGQSSKIFKSVAKSGNPLVVMHHNKALVVVLPIEKYCTLVKESIKIDPDSYTNKEYEND